MRGTDKNNFYSWDEGEEEVHTRVPRKIKDDGDDVLDTSPKVPCQKPLPFAMDNP